MNLLNIIVITALQTQAAAVSAATPAKSQRVYIVVPQKTTEQKQFAPALRKTLALSLGKYRAYQAIAQRNLAAGAKNDAKNTAKNDAKMQEPECQNSKARCLQSLGQHQHADLVLTAQWARMGDTILLNLTLVQVSKARVIGRASNTAQSKPELLQQMDSCVARLLKKSSALSRQKFHFQLPRAGAKVAVMPLHAQNIKSDVAAGLTQVVAQRFKNFQGFSVISEDDIKAMLALESDKQMLGCTDVSCMAEIGGALGVDFLVNGSVGKIDDTFFVSLKIIDADKVKVINRVSQTFKGRASDLLMATMFASEDLVGVEQSGQGTLQIKVVPKEAVLSIDDRTQVKANVYRVGVGQHRILLEAKGYYSSYIETYVRRDATSTLQVKLEAIPRPWYAQWWAWTAASATLLTVTAGTAVAVAALAANANPPATSGDIALTVSRGD